MPEVSWVVAFGAGLLSFFSPCVAPLVPGYVGFISGTSVADFGANQRRPTGRVLGSTLLFVLGFSLVFVLLGASASFVGGLLDEYRRPLGRLAGAVMIAMGLVLVGLVRGRILWRDWRFHLAARPFGPAGTVLLGMAFGFGWTPCVGPILASILFYAGATETAGRGALLLLAYSVGLGVPFVLSGVGLTHMLGAFAWVKRHYAAINAGSGALLIAVGLLFVTERFFWLSIAAQRLYYAMLY